jgi:DNA-binding CsgD family transcriptional regulator
LVASPCAEAAHESSRAVGGGRVSEGQIQARLSDREVTIVRLVADGLTNAEIGRALHLSERTVHGHVRNARKKLSARSRTHLVTLALRAGVISLHPTEGQETAG